MNDRNKKRTLTEYNTIYGVQYPEFVEITKDHERIHWGEWEAKLGSDVEQWKNGSATESEKSLIMNILRLFTQADLNVGQGYYDKIIPVIKNSDARNMLGSFANREGVHQRAYALFGDTMGFNQDFYWEFMDYAEMKEKHEYQIEQIGSSMTDFATYLAKQTLIEGVSLFSSFAMLLNFDRLGKFPGLSDIIKWSIADESMHIAGNSKLFAIFLEEHPRIVNDEFKQGIYQTARDIVKLEDKYIDKAFSIGGVKNLTAEEVKQYVRYVANYRLQQLGFKANWTRVTENPLPWVDALSGKSHGNFFEREIVEYSKDAFADGSSFEDAYAKYTMAVN